MLIDEGVEEREPCVVRRFVRHAIFALLGHGRWLVWRYAVLLKVPYSWLRWDKLMW